MAPKTNVSFLPHYREADGGHGFGTKVLFALIRAISRQPILDVINLVKYRADFYGAPMQRVTHEAMRGPSAWSVGDRELMAALVAQTNECEWCTKAHTAVAQRAYRDAAKVSSVLSDLETAAIESPLRATLRMLRNLTREHSVDADDMRTVLVALDGLRQLGDPMEYEESVGPWNQQIPLNVSPLIAEGRALC